MVEVQKCIRKDESNFGVVDDIEKRGGTTRSKQVEYQVIMYKITLGERPDKKGREDP